MKVGLVPLLNSLSRDPTVLSPVECCIDECTVAIHKRLNCCSLRDTLIELPLFSIVVAAIVTRAASTAVSSYAFSALPILRCVLK